MKRMVAWVVLIGFVLLPTWGGAQPDDKTAPKPAGEPWWQKDIAGKLRKFGQRNWIVITDAAYPWPAQGGMETTRLNADHLEVVKAVLEELAKVKHVRPIIYLDAELPFVPERDAPGMNKYRTDLKKLLGKNQVYALPHQQLLQNLGKAGENFKVLIVKTNLMLPYTSVFLELECGYWSAEAEQRLREAMERGEGK